MAYKDFDGRASTQTDQERAAEAKRILTRIGPWLQQQDEDGDMPRGWTEAAQRFVLEQYSSLELTGKVEVTPKQLFYLRDLAEVID